MHDQHTSSEEPLPLSLSQQQEIDRLCTAFEGLWRKGERPRIEEYLLKAAAPLRTVLLKELIAQEWELRQGSGECVDIAEYNRRFPENQHAVSEAWELLNRGRRTDASKVDTASVAMSHAVNIETTDGVLQNDASDGKADTPDNIGRYKITKLLGSGGFGEVHLAHDTRLDRQVALKVPLLTRFASPEAQQQFMREARNAAKLDHPGIVQIYDVQDFERGIYIVEQYIDGHDLSKVSQSRHLTPLEVVNLVIKIADALGHAHQRGFVHRDLKPANVLIDGKGDPHIVDFGLAIDEDLQRAHKGEVAGTYPYMSPEQVRGDVHRLDGRSDLWSLGVILYELLCGRRPFGGRSAKELFDEIQNRDPRPLRMINPAIPVELQHICSKCLSKRHTDRYTSAIELVEELQQLARRYTGDNSGMRRSAPRKSATEALREMTNLGSLIPYLVDRDEHDYRIREVLERARDRHGSSLVCCIVHGMEDQCHDTFVERLKECTLRQCLGLRETQPVKRYHVHFPTQVDSRDVLWERLRVQVCDRFRLDPNTKVDQLAQAIARAPCPSVIYSELATGTHMSSCGSLIDAYLAFWDQLLVDRLRYPTIVCLGIVYRRGVGRVRQWFAAQQTKRVRREVQCVEFSRYRGIVGTILPELQNLTRDDADNWLQLMIDDFDLRQELRPVIHRIFERIPEVSMEQWRESLRVALSAP